MALKRETLSFLFLAIFLFSHQIQARDSQFFSKVTNDNNPKETTTNTVVIPKNDNNNNNFTTTKTTTGSAPYTTNVGNDRSYNPERQGRSDTGFLNGKYFYDVNSEKNYDPNSYRESKVAKPNPWRYNTNNNRGNNNYYGHNNENDRSYENHNNSFEGYQNQEEDQFQENEEEFKP